MISIALLQVGMLMIPNEIQFFRIAESPIALSSLTGGVTAERLQSLLMMPGRINTPKVKETIEQTKNIQKSTGRS